MGPFVLTEGDASIANPSPPYADEDMVILSGVKKEHKSNVYGYVSAFDVHVWMMLLCFTGFAALVALIIEYIVGINFCRDRWAHKRCPTRGSQKCLRK